MKAVEALKLEEMFQVESNYTSTALKTSLALEEWWKRSKSNYQRLSSFSLVLSVRLGACFASKWSGHSAADERKNLDSLSHIENG